MRIKSIWNTLGPGILLAAASVGASHLVMSPQAGALFGSQLLWLVVACHLFKYPAFEFGPRYAAATGRNLLEGYLRIPGPKGWALWLFLASTMAQGIGVLAGVVSVAGAVLATWTSHLQTVVGGTPWVWHTLLSTEGFSIALAALIVLLLFSGGFSWLDHLNKVMMAILAVSTLLAFLPIVPEIHGIHYLVVPTIPQGSIVLIAAILGWMPTGIDVSIWHSFWTVEKQKQLAADKSPANAPPAKQLHVALLDMRTGYGLSLCTGIMFICMGAVHLGGRGEELKSVEFAEALSTAYTAIFGRWMYHVFMLTAFFAMFSTSYTVVDGFSRSFSECLAVLIPSKSTNGHRRVAYFAFAIGSTLLACSILVRVGQPVLLVTSAALISLAVAPFLYAFNLFCVKTQIDDPHLRPPRWTLVIGFAGVLLMVGTLILTAWLKLPGLFAEK
jgi:Mn2+/Fe2+ NRAMP family transporter